MTQLTAVAAVLIVGLIVWTQFGFVKPTFAEVVRPLLNAQTLVYDFITGPENEGPVMHDIVSGGRIRRTISTMDSITMILDIENARMLHLESGKKEARYFDMKGPLQLGTQEFLFIRTTFGGCRNAVAAEKLEAKTSTAGSHWFPAGGQNVNSNLGRHEDLAAGADCHDDGAAGDDLKNFQFDIPVDAALVSMDIPAGYTLAKSNMDLADATEEDFIAGLKVWAEVFLDGRFPDSITNDQYMKQIPLLEGAVAFESVAARGGKVGTSFVKGMMFISVCSQGA
jgi:hypothetical protein